MAGAGELRTQGNTQGDPTGIRARDEFFKITPRGAPVPLPVSQLTQHEAAVALAARGRLQVAPRFSEGAHPARGEFATERQARQDELRAIQWPRRGAPAEGPLEGRCGRGVVFLKIECGTE